MDKASGKLTYTIILPSSGTKQGLISLSSASFDDIAIGFRRGGRTGTSNSTLVSISITEEAQEVKTASYKVKFVDNEGNSIKDEETRSGVVGNSNNGQYDTKEEVLWATGACLLIRSTDYWKADGLDGRFFAHNEEIDLCWRLRIMGRKIVCLPDSVVYHLGGGTLPKGNPRKTFLNFRNNLTMLYKCLPDKDLRYVMRNLWCLLCNRLFQRMG